MKLSSRDQMILFGVIVAVVAIAFVVLAIVPRFSDLSRLESEKQTAQQQIAEAQALLSRRQQAKAEAASTQAELNKLDNEMPDTPELPSLIISLQDAANGAGIEFDRLTPAKPGAAANGYAKIGMTFDIQGEWTDYIDFLRRLETLDRPIRVLNMNITPYKPPAIDGVEQKPQVSVVMRMEAYMLAASTGGAPGVPPAPGH